MHHPRFQQVGPVGIHQFQIDRQCEINRAHVHAYAHAWIVTEGQAELRLLDHDGQVLDCYVRDSRGAAIEVPAGMRHEVKGLVVPVRYLCIFTHRDTDGQVSQTVQEYAGADLAYRDL